MLLGSMVIHASYIRKLENSLGQPPDEGQMATNGGGE